MKVFFGLLLVTLGLELGAQTLSEVRNAFHQAVLDPKESRTFHDFLKEVDEADPTLQAYKAVSEALLAQVVWNPFSKFSQVLKYNKLIEKAVIRDQQNIEIRFLRLAIEYNLPAFLGMSTHMEEDLGIIVSNMESVNTMQVDPGYGRYIFYFLESTELCTSEQILAMKENLSEAKDQSFD